MSRVLQTTKMDLVMIDFSDAAGDGTVSELFLDRLVGFALAVWTCGQLVFAHSTVGQSSFIQDNGIAQFHLAIVIGCLITVLSARSLKFTPLGNIALFCGLLATITVWRKTGDTLPIALFLLVLAAKDMDISFLAQYYLVGAFAGLAGVLLCSALGLSQSIATFGEGHQLMHLGFYSTTALWSLMLSMCMALSFTLRDRRHCPIVAALCLAYAIVSLLLTHAFLPSLLMIVVAIYTVVNARMPEFATHLLADPLCRFAIAVLPLALLYLATDGQRFFGLVQSGDGLASAVQRFGIAVVVCIALLYFRAALLARPTPTVITLLIYSALFSLCMLTASAPFYLEFNCSLLVLGQGFRNHARLMPMLQLAHNGHCYPDDAEADN